MVSLVKKHNDFLKRWEGKRFREAWIDTYECVALAKLYANEVLGEKLGWFGGSAYKAWQTGSPFGNKWKKQENSLMAKPPFGSIVFFAPSKANGWCGHVSVVGHSNLLWMEIIEQNGGKWKGTGTGTDAIRKHKHYYGGCLGWYSLK